MQDYKGVDRYKTAITGCVGVLLYGIMVFCYFVCLLLVISFILNSIIYLTLKMIVTISFILSLMFSIIRVIFKQHRRKVGNS